MWPSCNLINTNVLHTSVLLAFDSLQLVPSTGFVAGFSDGDDCVCKFLLNDGVGFVPTGFTGFVSTDLTGFISTGFTSFVSSYKCTLLCVIIP